MYYAPTVQGHSDADTRTIIRTVASDFRAERWYEKACYIDGTQVSLWALMYALVIQEWGRRDGTAGHRTNNRGSLHRSQGIKPVVWLNSIDNTRSRPSYNTPYDWLYELAYLITKENFYYKCNISYTALWAYIKWPRAPHTAEGDAYVWTLYRNLKKRALEFDGSKGVMQVTEVGGNTVVDTIVSLFDRASEKQSEVESTRNKLYKLEKEAIQFWKECIDEWKECKK